MDEIDFAKLPNFFIIGAAKAGTTSLHDVLSQHPEIFLSKVKEPSFFNNENRYALGLYWYQETHFGKAERYSRRGESTASSLYWSTVVAPRIKKAFGEREVKLIAIFRDPVMRAYSYYWMKVQNGLEFLSFEDALAQEEERLRGNWEVLERAGGGTYGYFRGGCYATLLQPFLEQFPRRDFAFIMLDDFQKNFAGTMVDLAKFLEVRADFKFKFVQSNSAFVYRNQKLNQFLRHPTGPLYNTIKFFTHRMSFTLRHQVRKGVIHANLRPQAYQPMNLETERQLRERFSDEIERLEIILDRDLTSWKAA
jgi:hypothetical protein